MSLKSSVFTFSAPFQTLMEALNAGSKKLAPLNVHGGIQYAYEWGYLLLHTTDPQQDDFLSSLSLRAMIRTRRSSRGVVLLRAPEPSAQRVRCSSSHALQASIPHASILWRKEKPPSRSAQQYVPVQMVLTEKN
jgi:hypothetical protein